jgi:hypothetical protein
MKRKGTGRKKKGKKKKRRGHLRAAERQADIHMRQFTAWTGQQIYPWLSSTTTVRPQVIKYMLVGSDV